MDSKPGTRDCAARAVRDCLLPNRSNRLRGHEFPSGRIFSAASIDPGPKRQTGWRRGIVAEDNNSEVEAVHRTAMATATPVIRARAASAAQTRDAGPSRFSTIFVPER